MKAEMREMKKEASSAEEEGVVKRRGVANRAARKVMTREATPAEVAALPAASTAVLSAAAEVVERAIVVEHTVGFAVVLWAVLERAE